jgi:hypothetical protein
MIRFKPSRLTVAVTLSALVIILAGSGAIASNMGFKLNKGLFPTGTVSPGVGGDNWLSIPYNSPYSTFASLCTALGLPPITTNMFQFIPMTGSQLSCNCGSGATCGTFFLNQTNLPVAQQLGGVPAPFLGIRIRNPNGFPPAGLGTIVVGSHNPTQPVLLNAIPSTPCPSAFGTSGHIGEVWFSVPYHTTALTGNDICTQAGISLGGATIARQSVGSATPQVGSCGFGTANFNLVLGEAVRMRRVQGNPAVCTNFSFIPAHF